MSDPRMIPADEAKAMRELLPGDLDLAEYDMFDRMAKWLPYYRTYAAAPDLTHTVIAQAEQIETLSSLLAGAEKAATDRSEQIKRLQDAVVAWREVIEERYNNDLLADLVDDGIITAEDMEDSSD